MASDNLLAQVLNFTPEDLELNRLGKLTAQQTENLHRYVRKQEPGCVVFSLFVAAFGGVMVGTLAKQTMPGLIAGIVIFGLMVLLTVALLRRSANALDQGDVKIAEGACSRRITHTGGKTATTNYYVKIGDTEFNVELPIYNAFQDGLVYRAYYVLLYADTIVSAELA